MLRTSLLSLYSMRWPERLRLALSVVAVALVFASLAYGGLTLTRGDGRIAALWLPNAVLAAVLLRNRSDNCPLYLVACLIGNFVVNCVAGDRWLAAGGMAAANAVEVVMVVWTMRRLCGRNPQMQDFKSLGWLLLVCLVAPAISGLLAALTLQPGTLPAAANLWFEWILADGLSLMIVTPVVMIATDAWRARRTPTPGEILEWSGFLAGSVVAVMLIFGQSRFPFLFLACPIVIVAAFRKGIAGTAAAIALISLVASVATYLGTGPIMLVRGGTPEKLLALQAFLATSFAMGLPVAAALEGRQAIRRELQASRDFSQSILDNIQEIIFRTDATGHWVFLNPAWEVLTGYSVAESLGWKTTKLLHPDDFAESTRIYPNLVAGKIDKLVMRQRFFRKSGESRHIEITVRRLSDEQGEFAGSTGNIRDVTETVEHERALAESEARFRRIAEAAPVGIFRTNALGRCTYANAAWMAITGVAQDAWLEEGWSAALHPDDRDRVFNGWAEAVRLRRNYRAEFRWIHPNGGIVWTDVLGRPEVDASGGLTGFLGVTVDITARRIAEERLAERERQLALLAENATDAVFRLTLDGHCIYASPSAGELLGVDPALLVGAQMLTRFHPDDADEVLATFAGLANRDFDHRTVAYRSDIAERGTYRWMEANCGVVLDDSGAPCEVIASIRDVSENKAMEQALQHARQRAENAVAAKAAFLANMSHEIRTPMNGVLGFTDLLANSDLRPDQRRQVQLIAESGRAMMRLLNDILDMSKIDAGQMTVTSEPFDLRHKLHSSARLMEPIAERKGVGLAVEIAPDVPDRIFGDPLRVRQILLNLIGNAVKFTENGSITVRAAAGHDADAGWLILEVADSGVGIAADRLDLIFHQFTQADASIAPKYGGTGLGLSISSELVKLMGGTIKVDSEPGTGTTFTVQLPLVAAPAAEASLDDETGEPVTRDDGRPLRVLIAEDHDINQELIVALVMSAGMDPVIAPDGAEAIELIKRGAATGKPYDLVLMDLQMPVLGGLEATRRLRRMGFSPARLPIVALTANAYAEDIEACLDAGMQAHLAKPVRLRELRAVAAEYVRPASSIDVNIPVETPGGGTKTLAQRYEERRRETLEAISAGIGRGELDGATVTEIVSMLHKLAGTAAFFGEAKLGYEASVLERALLAADPNDVRAVMTAGLAELEKAA